MVCDVGKLSVAAQENKESCRNLEEGLSFTASSDPTEESCRNSRSELLRFGGVGLELSVPLQPRASCRLHHPNCDSSLPFARLNFRCRCRCRCSCLCFCRSSVVDAFGGCAGGFGAARACCLCCVALELSVAVEESKESCRG